MKKVSRDELAKRVEHWRSLILPEWEIVLMRKPPEDVDDGENGCNGHVQTSAQYRSAKVWVNPQHDSDYDLDETIAHELVHCILAPLTDAYDELFTELGTTASIQARHRRSSLEEPIAEQLSRVVVSLANGKREATRWNPRGH